MRSWTSALILLLGGGLALAGGPDPGVRRRALGECGNGEPCIAEAANAASDCSFADPDGLGDGFCGCTDTQCTVAAAGVFTGELSISINEDCPDGTPGARVTMRLAGRTETGVGFEASTAEPLDFCDVDVETPCTQGSSARYTTPFFCSNDRDDVLPEFLQESMLPTADWLVLHPLPASMARTIRAAFGASGVPVVMRAETCGSDQGTPDPTDGLPMTRTYCVKGHLAHPPVPLADCDPGRQTACIASEPLPSEGGIVASTIGGSLQGRFESSCGGAGAPEVMLDWVPTRSGLAVLSTVGPNTNFGSMIYVLDGPCAAQSPDDVREIACQGNDSAFFPACTEACCNEIGFVFASVLELDGVQAGKPYCVVVDSGFEEAGIFDLSVAFCPDDRVVTTPEGGGRCTAPPPGCGAGATGARVLEPARADSFEAVPCTSPCCRSTCGDGERDPGEECDDGNTLAGDGCDACRREATYQCRAGVETSCGASPCLLREGPCCPGSGECTQPDGAFCVDFNFEACCSDAEQTCCRVDDGTLTGGIVCDAFDGGTCRTNALGGLCPARDDQCVDCRYGAERECGLDRMLCFDGTAPGQMARHAAATIEDYLDEPHEYALLRTTGLCVPATEALPGRLVEHPADPRTALASVTLRPTQSANVLRRRIRLTDDVFPHGVVVDLGRTTNLLVPSAAVPGGSAALLDPASHRLDHYRCSKVSLVRGLCARSTDAQRRCNRDRDCVEDGGFGFEEDLGPCIERQRFPDRASTIATALQTSQLTPTRMTRLCVATSVDGSPLADDRLHLACYRVSERCAADSAGCRQGPYPRVGTASELGAGTFAPRRRADVCFPARIDLFDLP